MNPETAQSSTHMPFFKPIFLIFELNSQNLDRFSLRRAREINFIAHLILNPMHLICGWKVVLGKPMYLVLLLP
jgi:hypothetical protein